MPTNPKSAPTPRVWFVTGSSSGVGLAMTKHALAQGDSVVATLRNPSALPDSLVKQYPKERLLVLRVDVTRLQDITDAFAKAEKVFRRVDVVFNNAGYMIIGELEATSVEQARNLFDVNFWGATNVAREAVRFMRDENIPRGGVILNVSSQAAFKPFPAAGYYGATKAALNNALESLSQEIPSSWNIQITIIELGAFRTRIFDPETLPTAPIHPSYTDPTYGGSQFRAYLAEQPSSAGDTAKGVAQIYELVNAGQGEGEGEGGEQKMRLPLHLPLGKDAIGFARERGEMYRQTAERWAGLSDDVEFSADDSR